MVFAIANISNVKNPIIKSRVNMFLIVCSEILPSLFIVP
jgi:hypothetical protein